MATTRLIAGATMEHLKVPDTTEILQWLLVYNGLTKSGTYNPGFNRDEAVLAVAAEQMRVACQMSLLAIHLDRTN